MDETSNPPDDFATAFESAFARLQVVVATACAGDQAWPAKVAAAIYAALDFAVADPTAARLLTIDTLIERASGGRRYAQLIERFAELLRAGAPRERRLPASTEQALIGGLATTVTAHLRTGRLAQLPEVGPELVELILMPYLGRSEAQRWARLTTH